MNIEVNGVNLQADFMDAEFMDKLEPALAEVQKKLNHGRTQNYESVGAAYRELNGYIEHFFDDVFGSGTSDHIFKGSQNIKDHIDGLSQVNDLFRQSKKEFNDFTNKYTQRQQVNGFNSMQGYKKKKPHPNVHR